MGEGRGEKSPKDWRFEPLNPIFHKSLHSSDKQLSVYGDGRRNITMNMRILLPLAMALSLVAQASDTNSATQPVKLPPKRKVHLYLLMGQSNMAGRGRIEAEDKTANPRVLTFTTNGSWQVAVDPITWDKPAIAGVGPGVAFGKAMAESNPKVTIGLVPCAVGGTPLSLWEKGGDLYSNAVHRAKLAMKSGTLKGIIWHQGESDSKPGLAETYGDRLAQMIQDIRAELKSPRLPFVVGQLGEFIYMREVNNLTEARLVNDTLAKIPARVPHTGCASSAGLTHKGDQVHFDTASQRELGRRFAAEMTRLTTK
jgi:hypothetical protein